MLTRLKLRSVENNDKICFIICSQCWEIFFYLFYIRFFRVWGGVIYRRKNTVGEKEYRETSVVSHSKTITDSGHIQKSPVRHMNPPSTSTALDFKGNQSNFA